MNLKACLKKNKIVVAELLAILLVYLFAQALLSSTSLSLTCGFAIVYLIPRIIYSRSSLQCATGSFIFLFLAVLMSIGITLNIWQFTTELGGTSQDPILNNTDSRKYFNAALAIYNGTDYHSIVPYFGYSGLISMIWELTGVSVIVPILLNMFFTLMSIIVSAFISVKLIASDDIKTLIGTIAIVMTGGCCYYLGNGMVILKDPSIYLGVAMCALALVSLYKNQITLADYLLLFGGSLLLALNRVGVCYMVTLGIFILSLPNVKTLWRHSALMLLLVLLIATVGNYLASYGVDYQFQIIQGSTISDEYITTPQQRPLINTVGNYFDYPIWKRLLLLPALAAVQYLIPFPWNFMRDTEFGYTQLYSHIAYAWYCVGGLVLFYYMLLLIKRKQELTLWSLWAMICYLVPAYMFAGSVSRYFLPFIPLFVPLAIEIVLKIKEGHYRKLFARYSLLYIIIMAVTLIVCYNIQMKAL